MKDLTAQRGLIFRICHISNFGWHIKNGLVCKNSGSKNENFVSIGNKDLIDSRCNKGVPIPPLGMLSDYVPFYFTPFSPMMLTIKTGYNGITKRKNSDILIFASSAHKISEMNIRFVFTDRHAYLSASNFYSDLNDLSNIDWKILQNRDFKRDNEDPGKMERYQAEFLVYKSLPVEALLGVACYDEESASRLKTLLVGAGIKMKIVVKSGWYF